jgi:iron complex transport system ATP-binding protein
MNDERHEHVPDHAPDTGKMTVHSHVHEHADGTVHSHYHSHPGGDAPHDHLSGGERVDTVEYDSHPESHAGDGIPVHEHVGHRVIEAPLEVEGVSFAYPHADHDVFSGIGFKAHAGSMLAILGNNGAGKSTLLDLLAGLARPREGGIRVGDTPLSSLGRREAAQRIAYVAQQQAAPHLSVYDEVLLGRKPYITWRIGERDRQVVAHAIAGLGLERFANRYCDELSGGERQKVFIARALAQEPEILILDEPTSALDPKNQVEVMEAIRQVTVRDGLATVLVLHDINLALSFCDRFLLIRDGRVVAQGGHEAISDATLSETYDTGFKLIDVDGVRMALPSMR